METRAIVEALVEAINGGRAERVAAAMSLDAVFVDSLGRRIEGRRDLTEGWRGYFRLFPDYRIEVDGLIVEGPEALLHGRARGTLHRDGHAVDGGGGEVPAAWRAVSDGRRVALWQVYADNKPVYALLGM
ncbi:MAG TPA: nuclear transport factor 2 family protein [Allosphingosinicella sp.]